MAQKVGELVAKKGAILLCGGQGGIMEAAAKGAKESHGHTIGVLPGKIDNSNPYIDKPILTGLEDARNYINIKVSDAVIAFEGGAGTLSEIALALKNDRPLVYAGAWRFLNGHGLSKHEVPFATDPKEIVRLAFEGLNRDIDIDSDGYTRKQVDYPPLPSQHSEREAIRQFVGCVSRESIDLPVVNS